MVYLILAELTFFLHALIVIVWIGGWFLTHKKHPRLWAYHRTFGVVMFLLQIIFWNCPLVVLENYLRGLHDPKYVKVKSFTTHYLQEYFNISIPSIVIALLIILGGAISLNMLFAKWYLNRANRSNA